MLTKEQLYISAANHENWQPGRPRPRWTNNMAMHSTGACTKDVISGAKDHFRYPVLCQQYCRYCFKMTHIYVLQTFRNGRWNSTHTLTNDILCSIKPIYNQRSSLPPTIRGETTIKVKNILYIKSCRPTTSKFEPRIQKPRVPGRNYIELWAVLALCGL